MRLIDEVIVILFARLLVLLQNTLINLSIRSVDMTLIVYRSVDKFFEISDKYFPNLSIFNLINSKNNYRPNDTDHLSVSAGVWYNGVQYDSTGRALFAHDRLITPECHGRVNSGTKV